MADLSERHEVRVRGRGQTIVFLADSDDGRLIIRQEPDGKKAKDVCAITLSDPEELRAFFRGLRRIMAALGEAGTIEQHRAPGQHASAAPQSRPALERPRTDDREALVAQARQRNAQAFQPWSKAEEEEIRRRYEAGESIPAIARAHKRSPRAIELRLQRLGLLRGGES